MTASKCHATSMRLHRGSNLRCSPDLQWDNGQATCSLGHRLSSLNWVAWVIWISNLNSTQPSCPAAYSYQWANSEPVSLVIIFFFLGISSLRKTKTRILGQRHLIVYIYSYSRSDDRLQIPSLIWWKGTIFFPTKMYKY